jgi:hypothetical protein
VFLANLSPSINFAKNELFFNPRKKPHAHSLSLLLDDFYFLLKD